jgi:hypothetical protein
MPDEAILREKARSAIYQLRLPRHSPDRSWGGPGVGASCAVCEVPVTKTELEFEIQFAHDGLHAGLGQVSSSCPLLRSVGVRAKPEN